MAKFNVNQPEIAKAAKVLSSSLNSIMNNDSAIVPRGMKLNSGKIQNIVRKVILSPEVAVKIKRRLIEALGSLETEYQKSLEQMMLNRGSRYRAITDEYVARLKAQFPLTTKRRKRVHTWIESFWGGDWYAYKKSLSRRRLVKTGKKDANGKDIYNVYAGRLDGKNGKVGKKESNADYYMSVGQFKEGDRSKRYNKTLRSAQTTKSGNAGGGTPDDYDPDGKVKGDDFTSRLNPAKIGRRAARQTGVDPGKVPTYAVARAVQMAEQLRNKTQPAGGTKRKNQAPRGRVPYAKTGKLAHAYAKTFSFRDTDIRIAPIVKSTSTNQNRVNVTISGNFRLGSMAAEYRRVYLRTPVQYKKTLIYSAGNLFNEVVERQLFNKSKFKKG